MKIKEQRETICYCSDTGYIVIRQIDGSSSSVQNDDLVLILPQNAGYLVDMIKDAVRDYNGRDALGEFADDGGGDE